MYVLTVRKKINHFAYEHNVIAIPFPASMAFAHNSGQSNISKQAKPLLHSQQLDRYTKIPY